MITPSYNAKDSISQQDIAEINVRPYKDHGVSQHHRQAHSQIAALPCFAARMRTCHSYNKRVSRNATAMTA